jgi:TonB family protein
MRNAALERDDSILPFSLLFSFLVHGVVLMVVLPQVAAAPPVEVIQGDPVVSVFPGDPEFLNFSPDQKIITTNPDGIHIATSGDVPVERLRVEPTRDMPLRGQPAPNQVPTIDRVYMGNTNVREAQPSEAAQAAGETPRPRSQYRASIEAPEGPDGIVQQWERNDASALGTSPNQNPGGVPGAIRAGSMSSPTAAASSPAPSGYRQGVIDVPNSRPLRVPPTTPQSGQTLDHRPVAPAASVGPTVVDQFVEPPRAPGGDPDVMNREGRTLGPRRILSKPLPEYPEWALRDRVSATPRFHVRVGPNGNVIRSLLSASSGYSELDRLAQQAVERWLYEPRPGLTEERLAIVEFRIRR